MKHKRIIITASAVIAASAVIGVCSYFAVYAIKMNSYKNTKLSLPDDFTVTAHTGCTETRENSLESIMAGAENGAHITEFDLNFTADGTPVLSHDAPVGGEVTLDEAFQCLAELKTVRANIDIKSTDALEKVYPLAEKYGVQDRIFFTGVKEEYVEKVKEKCPQIPYYLNVDVDKKQADDSEYIQSLVQKVKDAGAVGINFNYKALTSELVEIFHENGLSVSVWTVDKEIDMYKCLTCSPDNITTRNPQKLRDILP